MLKYLTINTIVEISCFLIALFCLRKDASLVWRSMILFLFLTCIAELLGVHFKKLYLANPAHTHSNSWVYNILMIFQAGFTSLMFQHLLSKYVNSKPLVLSGLTLLTIVYSYNVFTRGFFEYNNLTNIIMSILFVLYSFYYYYVLLKDSSYVILTKSSEFWWVCGALFFYFGTTACNVFYYKLKGVQITPNHYLTYYIYNALDIIMYGCWSYSFICRKWQILISST